MFNAHRNGNEQPCTDKNKTKHRAVCTSSKKFLQCK